MQLPGSCERRSGVDMRLVWAQELTSDPVQVGAAKLLRCLLGASSGHHGPTPTTMGALCAWGGRAAQAKRAPLAVQGQLSHRPAWKVTILSVRMLMGGLPYLPWEVGLHKPLLTVRLEAWRPRGKGYEGHQAACSCPVLWTQLKHLFPGSP